MFDYTIQCKKQQQAKEILSEIGVEMWMVLGRETSLNNDPVLPLISGIDYYGASALLFTQDESIAIVSNTDKEGVLQTELFDKVIGYTNGFAEDILKIILDLQPNKIALNYSKHNVAADGLSHGLYTIITEILQETRYADRFISADPLISKLRGRKIPDERIRLENAVSITQEIFKEARDFIKVGQSEKDIYYFFHHQMKKYAVEPSWQAVQCPGVFVGGSSIKGHTGPTDIFVEKGDIVDIDFGVIKDEYCSDLQRIYYVLEDDEKKAPSEVQKAFETVRDAIKKAMQIIRPGVTGQEVDKVARNHIVSCGYPEWNHALGHEVGRFAHDGGVVLGPGKWGRYTSRQIDTPIESGMVFTLEPGIQTSRGNITIEEMLFVTDNKAEFLSTPQEELYLING